MGAPVVLKLREPIQFGEETITELVFQPMCAAYKRDLETDTTHGYRMIYALATKLTGQPPGVIDRLGGDDLIDMEEIVGGFLARSPKTGNAVSQ